MNTQFKKGILEMCILSIIHKRDMYGFEVIDALAREIDVNDNTVYPILRRLTGQGLFDTYEKQTNVGAPRKYYKITPTGEKKLKEYESEWRTFLQGVFKLLGGLTHENELS
jgi:PadR family transcriptional regulator, regulatory protein PadR